MQHSDCQSVGLIIFQNFENLQLQAMKHSAVASDYQKHRKKFQEFRQGAGLLWSLKLMFSIIVLTKDGEIVNANVENIK